MRDLIYIYRELTAGINSPESSPTSVRDKPKEFGDFRYRAYIVKYNNREYYIDIKIKE